MYYSKGSEWRKWDLHVHTPFSYINNFSGWDTFTKKMKEKAVSHDVEVVGINDYFSVDGYEKLLEYCEEATRRTTPRIKLTNDKWLYLLPVVELRLDNFTSDREAVNIHVVFSPDLLPSTIRSSFLEKLSIAYQKYSLNCKHDDLLKIGHAEENSGQFNANLDMASLLAKDKERFVHKALQAITFSSSIFEENIEKFQKILKDSGIGANKYLIILANKGNGGLDAFHWCDKQKDLSRAGNIRQNLLNLSDICFSNDTRDAQFLTGKCKDTSRKEILNRFRSCKPCIWGSDAHTEENIFHPSDGNSHDYTWIKADPTFEGLRQIVYEPEDGERVKISPIKPDQKDDYKIIKKIKFSNTTDFPEEIEFNRNLCSIIGSRSSGKSALLAYIAHSVDKERTEYVLQGPGEGEDYHWDRINVKHSIEWGNGKSNMESPGKIVFIRQNYLFEESKNPDEIKAKIEPVLFKMLPDFEVKYRLTEINLDAQNQQISDQVDRWFELSILIDSLEEQLESLGDKKAIEGEKTAVDLEIENLKTKNQLSKEEMEKYQEVHAKISTLLSRSQENNAELSQILITPEKNNFFSAFKITSVPSWMGLPKKLQDIIKTILDKKENEILRESNQKVIDYKCTIELGKKEIESELSKIKKDNSPLIEKYKKNIELGNLVQKLNGHKEILNKINRLETEIEKTRTQLVECEKSIKSEITQRKSFIEELRTNLDTADQSALKGIKFGVEYGFGRRLDEVIERINIKEKSEFITEGQLKINDIRENPNNFISAVYLGKQKIISGNNKKEVVRDVLSLTEKILFTAEMEGDKIGGFSEPTMTPGRRALFALKLILAESEDTWPLLIDQPEDDLDIRSIYDEVVPFLKEKKKERQIIMVSHNANLVIGADSEQIIIANRNGNDRKNEDEKQFNYLTGSLEYSKEKEESCKDTLKSQGVCEHACEILEGGKDAFRKREQKYSFPK